MVSEVYNSSRLSSSEFHKLKISLGKRRRVNDKHIGTHWSKARVTTSTLSFNDYKHSFTALNCFFLANIEFCTDFGDTLTNRRTASMRKAALAVNNVDCQDKETEKGGLSAKEE